MEIEKLEERVEQLEKGMKIVAIFIDEIKKEIKALKQVNEERSE